MNATATDLATLTAPELDERYVKVWTRAGHARSLLDHLRDRELPLSPYQEAQADKAQTDLAEALADEAVLDGEWDRRGGWLRYWLVTNHDGHVHRSMSCSTTFPTTRWALVTGLSGLTEDKMIEHVGHTACTVCFPQAPTHPAWVKSAADAEAAEKAKRDTNCPGSGTYAKNTKNWYDRYTTCHVCGRGGVSVTSAHNLRAHKSLETERAETLSAATADPKKIVAPDGSPLRARYGEVKTVVSAWRELVSDLDFVETVGTDNRFRAEYQESVERLSEALAAKLGVTVDEVLAQAREKLAAKRKRERR